MLHLRPLLRHVTPLGCLGVMLLCCSPPGPLWAAPVSGDLVEKWRADLREAETACRENHPDLFHSLDEATWQAEFDSLNQRVPELSHAEIAVELARIVARLEDGHTRLTLPLGPGIDFMQGHSSTPDPLIPDLRFHQFPVRFSLDSDGLHVRRIEQRWSELIGFRVVEIGTLDATSAIARIAPTIRRDNEQQLQHHLPMHLVLAEILHARGVITRLDRLPLTLTNPDGETRQIELEMVAHEETVSWRDRHPETDRHGQETRSPFYRRDPDLNFWMTELPETRTVYVQFNEVYDEDTETLRDFADRLSRTLSSRGTQNLIVDLRQNRGGDQGLARPLLYSLLCSEVNRTGHLFVLVGRRTFSAAMLFALSMETHTRALFVGEPTGSRPNHYGDSRKTRLTHSGLTLRVSTRYWQNDPTDGRLALHPHIAVERTAEDERAGRDPVIDTVMEIITSRDQAPGPSIDLSGTNWAGTITEGLNTVPSQVSFIDTEVRLKIPAYETTFEAHNVIEEGNEVSFVTAWENQELAFKGQVTGEWLIGEWNYETRYYPFVWRREP